MKKLLVVLGIVIALLVAVAVALPFFIDINNYKGKIEEIVATKTGRTMKIGGDISFRIFPDVALTMEKVTIGNPEGFPDTPFAEFETLVTTVKLRPLLAKHVEVDAISLEKPLIHLIKDKKGNTNWEFKESKADEAETATKDSESKNSSSGSSFEIHQVQISDASLRYQDLASGQDIKIEDLDVDISEGYGSLDAELSFDWQGKRLNIDAKTASLDRLLEPGSESLPVTLEASSDHFQLAFKGSSTHDPNLQVTGDLNLSTESVDRLLRWLDPKRDATSTLDKPLTFSCPLVATTERFGCKGLQFALAESKLSGHVSLVLASKRKPNIQANLVAEEIDVDAWLGNDSAASASSSKKSKSASSSSGSWKQQAVPTDIVDAVDANIQLQAKGVKVQGLHIGNTKIRALIRNRIGTVEVQEMALYKGIVRGHVELSTKSGTPSIKEVWSAKDIALGLLLQDLIQKDRFAGTMEAQWHSTSFGKRWIDMLQSLTGNAKVRLADGYVRGINLAELARNITNPLAAQNETAKTDFTEATASFVINRGIARNEDLLAKSPFLTVTGNGEINIVEESLNYLVKPSLVANIEGQGRQADSGKAIVVPVRIVGPWADPKIKVEAAQQVIEDIIKDPTQAKDVIKGYGKSLEGIGKQLKGNVLGKEPAAPAGTPATPASPPVTEPAPSNDPVKAVDEILKLF